MHILFICQYFPPEGCAPAARISELAKCWVRAGHAVTVLTGFPNHPTGILHASYRDKIRRLVVVESANGIRVIRTWLATLPNRKAWERILNYSSFCISSALTGTFLGKADVVIATSPPLLVGLTGWWVSRVRRMPFIFEVRDLWPESLSGAGYGGERSWLGRILHVLASFLYRHSDHIVTVSSALRDYLVQVWAVSPQKISVVENGVDMELFSPPSKALSYPRDFFIVAYVGTLGPSHGLRTILEAAAILQHRLPRLLFLIVGEGGDKELLTHSARERRLTNVRFLQQQPRDKVPQILRAADVSLVPLRRAEVFKLVLPSKMFESMACARPVVLAVEGAARQVLEESRGGLAIEPENPQALADVLVLLHDNAGLRRALGTNARDYVANKFRRDGLAERYLQVMRDLPLRQHERGTQLPLTYKQHI